MREITATNNTVCTILRNEIVKTLRQFLTFGVVGLSGLGVSLLIINAIMIYKGSFVFANIFAFFVTVTWNFFLNRRFAFRKDSHRHLASQWITFAGSCAIGATCSWAVSFGLYCNIRLFTTHYNLAILCGVAVGYIVNFTCAKYIVFKQNNN